MTLALGQTGCEDEKKKPQAAAADAGPTTQPLLDGKLGEAVARAEASAAAPRVPGKASSGENEPPEKGVFEAGAADKAHPRGAPAKIEILGEGNEPRAALSPKLEPGTTKKVTLRLGLRAQTPIDVDFGVTFKIEKPKDDKKGADASKKAAEGEAPVGPLVIGKIASAGVSSQRGSTEELSKVFAKLKGSEIRFIAAPDGSARDLGYELSKDADRSIESVVQALLEAMSLMIAPLPSKPVGAGAYWMVTDRVVTSGVEVVRYRVFRLTKAADGQASLSMDLRQYAADTAMQVPGAEKEAKLTLERFDSKGKGEIAWTVGSFLPSSADVGSQLQALVIPPGQPNQRGQVATETHLKLSEAAP